MPVQTHPEDGTCAQESRTHFSTATFEMSGRRAQLQFCLTSPTDSDQSPSESECSPTALASECARATSPLPEVMLQYTQNTRYSTVRFLVIVFVMFSHQEYNRFHLICVDVQICKRSIWSHGNILESTLCKHA